MKPLFTIIGVFGLLFALLFVPPPRPIKLAWDAPQYLSQNMNWYIYVDGRAYRPAKNDAITCVDGTCEAAIRIRRRGPHTIQMTTTDGYRESDPTAPLHIWVWK